MSFGIVASVGSAVIGAAATMGAARSASKAQDRATAAQQQASDQQIQLAREQRDAAQAALQPYVDRGNVANAYVQAALNLPGASYATPGATGAPAAPAQASDAELQSRYAPLYRKWQQGDTVYGVRYDNFRDYLAATPGVDLTAQSTTYANHAAPISTNPNTPVSAADVAAAYQATAPYQFGEREAGAQNALSDASYADLNAITSNQYAGSNNLNTADLAYRNTAADSDLSRSLGQNQGDYATRTAATGAALTRNLTNAGGDYSTRSSLAGAKLGDLNTIAGGTYTAAMSEADRAKAERAAQANSSYAGANALLGGQYGARTALTDQAVAAYNTRADAAANRAVDEAFSRGGVSGLVGQTRAGVAQVRTQNAQDEANTEAGWRRADYEPLAQGQLTNYAQLQNDLQALITYYNGDVQRAQAALSAALSGNTGGYYADVGGAYDSYAAARDAGYATADTQNRGDYATYANNRNNAYATSSAARDAAYADYSGRAQGALGDYNAALAANRSNLYAQRSQTQSNRAAAQQGAYSDWLNGVGAMANQGYQASTGQASAGQSYAASASNAISNAANAASAAAQNKGQIQQQAYSDIAGIVGNAYGALTRPKTPSYVGYTQLPSTPDYSSRASTLQSTIPYTKFSDRRLKRDVRYDHTDTNGLRWYQYHYIWDAPDAPLHVGVMADEAPTHAVTRGDHGYLMVDYSQLGVG